MEANTKNDVQKATISLCLNHHPCTNISNPVKKFCHPCMLLQLFSFSNVHLFPFFPDRFLAVESMMDICIQEEKHGQHYEGWPVGRVFYRVRVLAARALHLNEHGRDSGEAFSWNRVPQAAECQHNKEFGSTDQFMREWEEWENRSEDKSVRKQCVEKQNDNSLR